MSKAVLPRGWLKSKLSQVIQPRGEKISPVGCDHMQFIGMDHVEAHTTKIIGSVSAASMKSSAARFYSGDVLYGRLRPYLNKVAQPSFDGLASAEFIVFPDTELVHSKFLKFRLNAADFVSFASHLNEGDRPRVSFEQIGDFEIFVPPQQEQHRIVAKIEELFSELDKGIENLKTARAQLKVYRQALLKHAFEGKLTAQWRAENEGKLETAEALLKRIQQERAQHYQQQLANWEAVGKQGSKPKAPKPLPPLTAEELAELPELPEDWGWCKWEDILVSEKGAFKRGPFGSALKKEFFVKSGYKIYEQYCPINDDCSFERYYISDEKFRELEGFSVRADDFLVSCSGVTLGRITQIPLNFKEGIINQALLRVRVNKAVYDFKFFKIFFRSRYFQKRIFENSTGTAIPNVKGVNELKAIPLPLCSLLEQQQIILELEARLSEVDQLELTITTALQQAEALRQSILKKAFAGLLVPQDPHDEPASKLRARIKAEKMAHALEPKNLYRRAS